MNKEFLREIRIDPIVPTESVLVSTERGLRPRKKEASVDRDQRANVQTCPFCQGNEHMTPPEITSVKNKNNQWQLRVVENLYPVLSQDSTAQAVNQGLRQTIDGYGRHEVVIDHNHHGIAIHEMSVDHLHSLLSLYQQRMLELYASDARIRYVLVFKNFGLAAGASIAHTHSQIIALPVVPENVEAEVHFSAAYYRSHHHCVFCDLIDEAMGFTATVFDRDQGESQRQLHVGTYVVEKGERCIAIKPFASRYEWEVHILPLQHGADYSRAETSLLMDVAKVLGRTMKRLDKVLQGAQYNFFLHSLPHHQQDLRNDKSYHWHLEICPRTSIPTGFELGSGLFVNTVSPEEAAKQLRDVIIDD